jgi:hypothetical protein
VEGAEAEPEGAAKTVRRHHGQHHGEEAHDGQVNLKKSKFILITKYTESLKPKFHCIVVN